MLILFKESNLFKNQTYRMTYKLDYLFINSMKFSLIGLTDLINFNHNDHKNMVYIPNYNHTFNLDKYFEIKYYYYNTMILY